MTHPTSTERSGTTVSNVLESPPIGLMLPSFISQWPHAPVGSPPTHTTGRHIGGPGLAAWDKVAAPVIGTRPERGAGSQYQMEGADPWT